MAGNVNGVRTLITGGTGYLGARIGQYLSEHGYDVYLGSRKPNSNRAVHDCNYLTTDWEDPELEFSNGFDLIVHTAGMNAYDCAKNPKLALLFNGETTGCLAEKASNYGCKKFIYLSTVHVYESPLHGVFNEYSPALNTHPYATSHLMGEKELLKVVKNSNMMGIVLRLSNCFGYPLTDNTDCWGLVLNQFIRDAFVSDRIKINGNYSDKRDFLSINEFNKILLEILIKAEPLSGVINVSSGVSRTLLEVALRVSDIVSKYTGNKVELVKQDVVNSNFNLDIQNHALNRMNIYPSDDLDLEIREMLNYLKLNR